MDANVFETSGDPFARTLSRTFKDASREFEYSFPRERKTPRYMREVGNNVNVMRVVVVMRADSAPTLMEYIIKVLTMESVLLNPVRLALRRQHKAMAIETSAVVIDDSERYMIHRSFSIKTSKVTPFTKPSVPFIIPLANTSRIRAINTPVNTLFRLLKM